MTAFEKKQLFWTRLGALCAAGILLVTLALGGLATWQLRAVGRCLQQAESILGSLEEISTQLSATDWESVSSALNHMSGQLQEVDLAQLAQRLDELSVTLSDIDWESIAGDAASSLEAAQEGLQSAMAAIDELDIEALNAAINDLKTVIEPLARLMNRG